MSLLARMLISNLWFPLLSGMKHLWPRSALVQASRRKALRRVLLVFTALSGCYGSEIHHDYEGKTVPLRALLQMQSNLPEGVSPVDSTACAGRPAGAYADLNSPQCFIYCYDNSQLISAAQASGYRSCCEASKCFLLPSALLPLGACATCPRCELR